MRAPPVEIVAVAGLVKSIAIIKVAGFDFLQVVEHRTVVGEHCLAVEINGCPSPFNCKIKYNGKAVPPAEKFFGVGNLQDVRFFREAGEQPGILQHFVVVLGTANREMDFD